MAQIECNSNSKVVKIRQSTPGMIRFWYAQGKPIAWLQRRYGLSTEAIYHILHPEPLQSILEAFNQDKALEDLTKLRDTLQSIAEAFK